MDGANDRFINGRTTWLANHLIVYAVDKKMNNGNPYGQTLSSIATELPVEDFDLRKVGGIMLQGGAAAKAYELRKLTEDKDTGKNKTRTVGSNTNSIRAYFLPWGSNKTYRGKLGINADFFFTPTLNGCTFAYEGNGPDPAVAHANFVNNATQAIDQTSIDNDLQAVFGAAPHNTLIKTTYKPAALPTVSTGAVVTAASDYRATVIGIRTGNSWDFYYQNYELATAGAGNVYTGLGMCVPI